MRRRIALAFAAGLAASGTATAQQRLPAPPPAPAPVQAPRPAAPPVVLSDDAKALIGAWEFSNADRDKICTLTFKPDPAPLGFKLEFDSGCAAQFPFIKDIVAWRMNQGELLRLLDARGKALSEFSEVENGIYEAPTPGVGVLFLQNAAAAGPAPRNAQQMAGEWSISRSGKVICALTLTNTAAGDDYALRLRPGCDAFVTRFNPMAWRVDHDELSLLSPSGASWRFADDGGTWRRVPDDADGLTMARK